MAKIYYQYTKTPLHRLFIRFLKEKNLIGIFKYYYNQSLQDYTWRTQHRYCNYSLENMVSRAFYWSKTYQGHGFWANMAKEAKKLEKIFNDTRK